MGPAVCTPRGLIGEERRKASPTPVLALGPPAPAQVQAGESTTRALISTKCSLFQVAPKLGSPGDPHPTPKDQRAPQQSPGMPGISEQGQLVA